MDVDTYLDPPECWLADLADRADDAPSRRVLLDRPPVQFGAAGSFVRASASPQDGTIVPYTLIGPRDALDVGKPTVPRVSRGRACCRAMAAFAIPNLPGYSDAFGIGWLERGGVMAFAHIRGGGEFGPRWHVDAQREHRQRSFDDFIAVAEDLVATGVTTAAQLGIEGGSNGGLLVAAHGAAAGVVRRGALPRAAARHAALSEARTRAPHGSTNTVTRTIRTKVRASRVLAVSPCARRRRVSAAAADDVDARRPRASGARTQMAARMHALGHERVWYWENTDGGHGSADDLERAEADAAEFGFLWLIRPAPARR